MKMAASRLAARLYAYNFIILQGAGQSPGESSRSSSPMALRSRRRVSTIESYIYFLNIKT